MVLDHSGANVRILADYSRHSINPRRRFSGNGGDTGPSALLRKGQKHDAPAARFKLLSTKCRADSKHAKKAAVASRQEAEPARCDRVVHHLVVAVAMVMVVMAPAAVAMLGVMVV